MSPYEKQRQGERLEGWAFTFCKAAFLVLLFQRYALLALSGLATLFLPPRRRARRQRLALLGQAALGDAVLGLGFCVATLGPVSPSLKAASLTVTTKGHL